MEEVNSPKGWDEEEELDYSAVSRRREERKENGKHIGGAGISKVVRPFEIKDHSCVVCAQGGVGSTLG